MGSGPREGDWRRYGFGAAAIAFGLAFVVIVGLGPAAEPDYLYLPFFFQGVLPGAVFVAVGVWAIRRPADFARVVGAGAGALSAPLYYPLLGLAHPDDSGMDFGRGFVGLALLVMVPLNIGSVRR